MFQCFLHYERAKVASYSLFQQDTTTNLAHPKSFRDFQRSTLEFEAILHVKMCAFCVISVTLPGCMMW